MDIATSSAMIKITQNWVNGLISSELATENKKWTNLDISVLIMLVLFGILAKEPPKSMFQRPHKKEKELIRCGRRYQEPWMGAP